MARRREKSGSASADEDESAQASDGPRARRILPGKLWLAVGGPVVAGLLLTGLTALATSLFDGSKGVPGPRPGSLGHVIVRNPPAHAEEAPNKRYGTAARQTRISLPAVEVVLQNTGLRRSVLTGARFTIRAYGALDPCFITSGAPLEVSAQYDVVLPSPARVDQSVDIPISQQLASDEADRIAFRFGNPELLPYDRGAVLYVLEIALQHDNQHASLPVGRALISLPGTPYAGDVGPGPDADRRCVERNRALLRRLSAFGSATSTELDALGKAIGAY